MVCHPALREVVGTNLLRAIAGSDLTSSGFGLGIVLLLAFQIVELRAKQSKSLLLILQLRLFRLTVDDNSGGVMRQSHGRVRRIDALSAISRCTHHINADLLLVNLNILLLSGGAIAFTAQPSKNLPPGSGSFISSLIDRKSVV